MYQDKKKKESAEKRIYRGKEYTKKVSKEKDNVEKMYTDKEYMEKRIYK